MFRFGKALAEVQVTTVKYKISKSAGKCYTENGPSHVGRRLTPLRLTSSLYKSEIGGKY